MDLYASALQFVIAQLCRGGVEALSASRVRIMTLGQDQHFMSRNLRAFMRQHSFEMNFVVMPDTVAPVCTVVLSSSALCLSGMRSRAYGW